MSELDRKFDKAYKIASAMTKKLPPDVMLRFYAYYKQATSKSILTSPPPSGDDNMKNAFKLNAWFQVNNLSVEEAKQKYIELVEEFSHKKIS